MAELTTATGDGSAAKEIGKCCDGLALVLSRQRESDTIGLCLENMYSLRSGRPTRAALVVRFRKSTNRKAEFANATYMVASFCPFCGAEVADG